MRSSRLARSSRVTAAALLVAWLLAAGPMALSAPGDFQWAVRAGSTGMDIVYDVAIDSDGYTIGVGSFRGTVDFDPGAGEELAGSAGGADIFVWKLDPEGDLYWVVRAGGLTDDEAFGVAIDGDDNIFVTGYFSGTVNFDPNAYTMVLNSDSDSYDAFVWKLDKGGDAVWAVRAGSFQGDQGRDIAMDGMDPVVVGHFQNTVDFDPSGATLERTSAGSWDGFVWKLDRDGVLMGAERVGGAGMDKLESVAIGPDGRIAVVGDFDAAMDVPVSAGVTQFAPIGNTDLFVWELDDALNGLWARAGGGSGWDNGHGVAFGGDGRVAVTGNIGADAGFPATSSHTTLSNAGGDDAFVWMLDGGSTTWVRHLGSGGNDRASDARFDDHGTLIIAGEFGGLVDFDPGSGTHTKTTIGSTDAFVWALGPTGDLVAAAVAGGTGYDQATSLALSKDREIAIGGYFASTVDFDPGPGTHDLVSAGDYDGFVWRLAAFLVPDTDGDGWADDEDNFPLVYSKCRDSQATIIGTEGPDVIHGTEGADVIMGFGGDDTIYGHGGNDLICAGAGHDTVYGGDGRDKIYGENGHDALHGEQGSDWLYGGNGNDNLQGGKGTRDKLFGGAGTNLLNGGQGTNDQCTLGPTFKNCEVIF